MAFDAVSTQNLVKPNCCRLSPSRPLAKRTVTSALCVMGMRSDVLSFARYHHVLSGAVWQPLEDHPYPAPARLFKKGLTQLLNISYC